MKEHNRLTRKPTDLVGYVTWTDAFCLSCWQDELSEDVSDPENAAFALSHGNLTDEEYNDLGKPGSGVDLELLYHVALVDTGSAFPRERFQYHVPQDDPDYTEPEHCKRCSIALADYEDSDERVTS